MHSQNDECGISLFIESNISSKFVDSKIPNSLSVSYFDMMTLRATIARLFYAKFCKTVASIGHYI